MYQYIGPVETQTNSVHDAGRASPSDLESEIDWGSASEASSVEGVEPAPEHVAPWCELEVPDDGNRRRLRRKTLAGHIPHDVKCVKHISCKQSRLSDELGQILSVDWGTSTCRPQTLIRWGDCADHPATLTAIVFRDNGKVYYAGHALEASASARWLACHCSTINEYISAGLSYF